MANLDHLPIACDRLNLALHECDPVTITLTAEQTALLALALKNWLTVPIEIPWSDLAQAVFSSLGDQFFTALTAQDVRAVSLRDVCENLDDVLAVFGFEAVIDRFLAQDCSSPPSAVEPPYTLAVLARAVAIYDLEERFMGRARAGAAIAFIRACNEAHQEISNASDRREVPGVQTVLRFLERSEAIHQQKLAS